MLGFHPAISRWFIERLGDPTAAQRRGWEAIRSGQHTLISAPTGSGKTLAAFLIALDDLLREGLNGGLPNETRVVYVSPLKALSADIHKNLAEPRREIRQVAEAMGLTPDKITAAVRTGDTPSAERQAMVKTPPHILVTTPESLYLLLTAQRSREMLRTVRTVIVDEIHAVIESKRGAHLALTLERLEHVAGRPLQRIGLSATLKPIEEVARFLVGGGEETRNCLIINEGHRRALDLAIEITGSPLEAVMSGETWLEVYERVTELINQHRTTLVFVNTRRMAERVARCLSDRLGEDAVTAHHGSLSKELRLDAEQRLKEGKLRALVATASLELGIDIGFVDLVCQIGSPRRISTFLQRVGRSGHTVRGTPKGRLLPLSRDELAECVALVRAVREGELDRIRLFEQPLDVLAQQIVAEAACEDWSESSLFELFRRAFPYRALTREMFDEVVGMLAQGFSTRRGRRGTLIHRDAVNGRVRGRRGARLTAITCGGTIPETADYRVILEPEETFLGTVNEDFAIESMPDEIFQLGNTSWRILRIQTGVIRVADAKGEPPGVPFWLGEAPARSRELSAEVARFRTDLESRLDNPERAQLWLESDLQVPAAAAAQLVAYFAEAKRMLGTLPTQQTLIAERFFDEAGGMQLVIHALFGNRVMRAWGLSLRKRFCRQFNFELQAAATDDALLLSLGPQHSFPLGDVFRYLHPDSVRDILVQALLDAPVFQTRWRWDAAIALALLRRRGGRQVAPQIQRMEAEDLLAAVFPDAAACLENVAGDREIPDHPLVRQTIGDALNEAMDLDQLLDVLRRIHSGEITCLARDLPEPSPLCHEILNARPYAFLDDAPLEERRAHAVQTRRAFEPSSADDLGALDPAAIDRVRQEAWPEAEYADELHDALLTSGFLTAGEISRTARRQDGGDSSAWPELLRGLVDQRRAATITAGDTAYWVAAERLPEMLAVHADAVIEPANVTAPPGTPATDREMAIKELFRGRLEIVGPTTAAELGASLGIPESDATIALHALEGEGVVLRGQFTAHDRSPLTADRSPLEWCDRRLLARIHRYTLNRLRAEIEPVSAADFMRFLFAWQRIHPDHRASGLEGLAGVVAQLDGFELPAGAWEPDVLSTRMDDYDPQLLDALCLTGRAAWGRLSTPANGLSPLSAGPIRSTPIGLFLREHRDAWLWLSGDGRAPGLSTYGKTILDLLSRRGASFFQELTSASGLLGTQVEQALGELAALGLVTADSFTGLRALLTPSEKRKPVSGAAPRRHRTAAYGVETAGRWSLLRQDGKTAEPTDGRATVEAFARVLLRRYGVVFRRMLTREALAPAWRDLLLVYRRLEARGEVRGGRFVSGVSGEQFALSEAVGQLRAVRRREPTGELFGLSAADPLNLTGILAPGERIPALSSNRVLYRDGVPIAAREAGKTRALAPYDATEALTIERALIRKRVSPALRAYVRHAG